ncbi:T-cell surface glycoprotein CD4-like isoform X1 [Anomaloglossus baeobatrachus]|uniref:T-cell surface glycoprotein CD4-like isoform X1 n=1 Tax=Anomaloglossus baeobatrachus TaxID=238106 RepID=UPI003F4FCD5A
MKEKFYGFCLTFLCFQTCLSSALGDKILAEIGNTVSLPCNKPSEGDVEWLKGGKTVIKYRGSRKTFGSAAKDAKSYSILSDKTNDLTVMDVNLKDSGTYTCKIQNTEIRTVELFVFEVSVFPSDNLLPSEDLVLDLTPSSIPGLQVSWEKNGIVMSNSPKLEENNVQLNGDYVCRLTMDGGNKLNITTRIRVSGFQDFPSIVYASNKSPVTILWIFTFEIRKGPMSSDTHVEEGSISYSSQILNQLSVTEGAASWPEKKEAKEASEKPNDLSVQLLNPKHGRYQLEILLKIGDRRKKLTREVCVAGLTVSDSESDVPVDTNVPLHCNINCIESNQKLCWHQTNTNRETCGQEGKGSLIEEVTVGDEAENTWICSVNDGKKRIISANVTLTLQTDFLDLSNSLFWVTVGVGIFILILIVVIITLIIARNRRMRRARHRAWLLENLHQKRRCECKGFAPQRLRDNV